MLGAGPPWCPRSCPPPPVLSSSFAYSLTKVRSTQTPASCRPLRLDAKLPHRTLLHTTYICRPPSAATIAYMPALSCIRFISAQSPSAFCGACLCSKKSLLLLADSAFDLQDRRLVCSSAPCHSVRRIFAHHPHTLDPRLCLD